MLDIGNSGGSFVPYIKYNSKAGRWYRKNEAGQEVEVMNLTALFDFQNIRTGWIYFSAGGAPEKVFDPSLNQRAEKPQGQQADDQGKMRDKFKRGFELQLYSPAMLNGTAELCSTADAIAKPISDLYAAYVAAPESKQGMLPVVLVKGATPVTGKNGTNFTPMFDIVKWVARPAEFKGANSNVVPLPVQPQVVQAATQPAPQPQAASVSEF